MPEAVGKWHIAAGPGPTVAPGAAEASYLANSHRITVRIRSRAGGGAWLLVDRPGGEHN